MKILYKQVGYPAMVKVIKDEVEALWELLDGSIDLYPIAENVYLIYDSMAKEKELPLHMLTVDFDEVHGDVVVAAREEGVFRDLTDIEIRTAIEMMEEMEL